MKIENLDWQYPCGCGDAPDPRAEVKTAAGQFRIKKTAEGFTVQRFGANGAALNKDADGVPIYEPIDDISLAALIT